MKNNESVWGPVHRDGLYALSEVWLVLGMAIDLAGAQRCLGSGMCVELGPMLSQLEGPVLFTAWKFAMALVQIYLTRRLYDAGWRKSTAVANALFGVGFMFLGTHRWLVQ